MMTPSPQAPWMSDDLSCFAETVSRFIQKELLPHQERWQAQRAPDREAWLAAGRAGILLPDIPEAYGGGGGTFAHEAVVRQELARVGVHFGSGVQSIVAHYLLAYGDEAQKGRWLPRLARGELVGAIAMSEPGSGSDLQGLRMTARRDGDHYVISGSKAFVTNGELAGLLCLAVKTDSHAGNGRGISMILVETDELEGFHRGKSLEKLGMHGQDTCELFFDGVKVPVSHLLGPVEGKGFGQMMAQLPYERLSIAIGALASSERALMLTLRHVHDRLAFGKALVEFQNTRFVLAECATEARLGRLLVDDCIGRFLAGQLDDATAAMAKYWLTESQGRITDACLQLHGGYGYMTEYQIARLWVDARVQRIYAGSNEIMKEIIGWSLCET